jgi:hypothetical protein
MYDATNAEVTDMATSVKNVYTVSVLKSLADYSTTIIQVTKVDTTANIGVELAKNNEELKSSPPLSGSF